MNRIIGKYEGSKGGPLVIALCAVHGNEPAGLHALEEVFKMLEREPAVNPTFQFHGKLVALVGNIQALQRKQRFIEKDLNRLWTFENVNRVRALAPSERQNEDHEIFELLEIIEAEIRAEKPEHLVLFDLHTTSAAGGIFSIPTGRDDSLELAKELQAPVILGLMTGIGGTFLHYLDAGLFFTDGYPKTSIGVAFEGGQHEDPLSVSRLISATIDCLRAAGCVRPEDVDSRHDEILREYSSNLPKVTRIRYVHHITPEDDFKMKPGYQNFQPVQQGEWLAEDVRGKVVSPHDGLILMPLYQKKGSDGFFLVDEI